MLTITKRRRLRASNFTPRVRRDAVRALARRPQGSIMAIRSANALFGSSFRRTNVAIPRSIKIEKKGLDTDLSGGSIIATTSTNANAFVLNLVATGNGSWNRGGRKITCKTLRIKGSIDWVFVPTFATGSMLDNYLRMVVVWDQQPSGAAIPTFDAIFGITAQDGTESCPDITCPPRYDNMSRFRVLFDTMYRPNSNLPISLGTAPTQRSLCPIDEYIKLKVKDTVFSGQSVPMTIADISTGSIYVYFRAANNEARATTTVDAISRMRYFDV